MRGLTEHSCRSCGTTAELLDATAGWACPSCTQTADLRNESDRGAVLRQFDGTDGIDRTRTRGGYEIEVTPDLYGFFIWKDGDCVAYIHPDEAVRLADAELARSQGHPTKGLWTGGVVT